MNDTDVTPGPVDPVEPEPVVTPSPRPPLPSASTVVEPPPAPVEGEQARTAVRFHSDDDDEVSLPGYLNAVPSIVSDGDVFVIDTGYLDELTGDDDRFEHVEGDPASFTPNATLTKAELGEKLGLDEAAVDAALKPDLVAQADDYDKANPQPSGDAGDSIPEDTDQ